MVGIGCVAKNTTLDPATGIDQASGRIHVRADFIQDQADQIINASIGTPVEAVKPHAVTIKDQAGKIGIDQDEVDRLMADQRKVFQDEIDKRDVTISKLEEKLDWLPRIVSGIAGIIGLGLIVVGTYASWTAKTTLNGTGMIVSGVVSMSVGWAAWKYDWLIGLVGVAFIATVGTFQIINQIRKQREQSKQIIRGVESLKGAKLLPMTGEVKDVLNASQTSSATRALVKSVTDKTKALTP